MTYERGKDKDLDLAVDELRVYLPGFYPGCTLEIIDASEGKREYIGKKFKAARDSGDIKDVAYRFEINMSAWFIDRNNTYGINYQKHHLQVVDPVNWDTNDSRKDPRYMNRGELVIEMQVYYPGFYVGCTMEIIKKPFPTHGWADVGKTFSTADISNARLIDTIKALREGYTFILDPNNTYGANYTKDCLKVQKPLYSNEPNSMGYRIKTIDEMEAEYGSLLNVRGIFTENMSHLSGMAITDTFALKVLDKQRQASHITDFINPTALNNYVWSISNQMITNKPLPKTTNPLPKTTDVKEDKDLVFGKYKIGQIVVSLVDRPPYRQKNEILEVLDGSWSEALVYKNDGTHNGNPSEWRAATEKEAWFYHAHKYAGPVIIDSTSISNQPEVGVDQTPVPVKKHEEPLLISDFTTAQLKPKRKRVKLSIN